MIGGYVSPPEEVAPLKIGIDQDAVRCWISDFYVNGAALSPLYAKAAHSVHMTLGPSPVKASGTFSDTPEPGEFETLGDIVFLPAGRVFQARSAARVITSIHCMFAVEKFPDLNQYWTNWDDRRLSAALDVRNATVASYLQTLSREISAPGVGSSLLIESTCASLAVELARYFGAREDRQPGKRGGLAPWRLKRIQELLAESDRALSLAEFASACQLNPQHLTRAFKQETGQSLGAFVRRYLHRRARELLAETDMPIASIGAKLGFASSSSFSQAFFKAEGVSPREFRIRAARAKRGRSGPS